MIPFPREEVTPPVTKIYFADTRINLRNTENKIKNYDSLACINLRKFLRVVQTSETQSNTCRWHEW